MQTEVTFNSGDETPKIEIEVNGSGRNTWLSLEIGEHVVSFFNNPEKVLEDLRHAIRVAEDTLFRQEQAEVAS